MSSISGDSIFLISSANPKNARFGTGFLIHQDESGAYILTCAHVVNDVEGSKQNPVRVNERLAQVIALDDNNFPDLAVLKVADRLDKRPLVLKTSGESGSNFITAGWFKWSGQQHLIKELRGEIGKRVALTLRKGAERVNAWDVEITDDDILEPGYSGSPVMKVGSNCVFGVISDRQRGGKRGLAISIEALRKIWPAMPPELIKSFDSPRPRFEEKTPSIMIIANDPYWPEDIISKFAAGQGYKIKSYRPSELIAKIEDRCLQEHCLSIIDLPPPELFSDAFTHNNWTDIVAKIGLAMPIILLTTRKTERIKHITRHSLPNPNAIIIDTINADYYDHQRFVKAFKKALN